MPFLQNFSHLFTFFRYHLNGAWFNDDSVVISCEGDGPTTPASTTSRPDTTTSQNNGPTTTASPKGTEYQKTFIYTYYTKKIPNTFIFCSYGFQSQFFLLQISAKFPIPRR